jgi:integrase
MQENVLLPHLLVDTPIRPIEPTLENVLVAIERDKSMSESRREALCCSIRRIAKFLERDPAQLPARLQALRFGIVRLHHAQLGVSRKTLQNHLANLKAAVRQFSSVERISGRGVALNSTWQALYDQLTVPRLRLGLSGFLRYCSASGIEPSSVSDVTAETFARYASEVQFTVKSRDLHKQVARCWNRARESVQDWPQTILTVPDFRPKADSIPWDAFPRSLVEDVERYLALLGGDSILDKDAPDRACKPSTIAIRRNYLRLAASAAVKGGIAAEELRSLADLVSPSTVRLILEHYMAKKGGKIVTFTIDMAERLCAIARVYVKAPETQIQVLERYCVRLRRKRRLGLTPKNMAVIRTFKNLDNRNRLKVLPSRLFDEALAERDAPIKGAVKAQIALAIQILLVAPMRLANLTALNLEQNVVRVGGIEPTYHLIIPPEEVKNEEPLEYPLPKMVNEMLGIYLAVFRPRLCPTTTPWLFPGESDGHKAKKTLSEQIIDRISEEIGIRVTPHQFRHLAAAFILEKDPANFEFVRRVLGHKNLQTTINFYIGLQTVDAVRKFSALALEDVTWRPAP